MFSMSYIKIRSFMNFLIVGNNQEQRDFNLELEKHVARKSAN